MYAMGRAVSLERNDQLKFDTSLLSEQEFRLKRPIYRLGYYNIYEDFAKPEECNRLIRKEPKSNVYRILRKISGRRFRIYLNNEGYIDQNRFHKDKNKITNAENIYLTGYWADYKFFSKWDHVIRKDLTLKTPLTPENIEVLTLIKQSTAIGIHIRRDDYLTQNNVFFNLPFSYYLNAIEYIKKVVDNPTFFIFSDDVEWCKSNFLPELINANIIFPGLNSIHTEYFDLELMRNCKHFIMANSTFGFWGAHLIENKNKIIIAPKYWYNKEEYQKKYDHGAIIPSNWIKLS
jgi:hypothetical protein